ncbi:hypothetical protein AAFF_G00066850 [Aldrovandia affinis]|uniref:Suppressor APC domain-containing protein n=1 Tax=Aldrovandia affinis TaxID=143900 RepID=A0AAD7WYP5_9TELE|nr:hypothetical protein AAFF_G00066850 [Aldrovandia affinis]
MQATETERSTDGIPRTFLNSLRTLFDILDDGKKGYVHILEIESRWRGADTRDLPGGVLQCLRRVAPSHGRLTFDRFVSGLRHSMLNPDNGHVNIQCGSRRQHRLYHASRQKQGQLPPQRPHGAVFDCAVSSPVVGNKVRPLAPSNGSNAHHNRTLATGYPASRKLRESSPFSISTNAVAACPLRYNNGGRERTGRSLDRISTVPESGPHGADSVRTGKCRQQRTRGRSAESHRRVSPQLQKTSSVDYGWLPRSQSETSTGLAGVRHQGRGRDERRRSTVTNAVDYETLKRMKELEQEKDTLLAGLEAVERAREWYQNQIQCVTERQRHVGRSNHCMDFLSQPSQTRLNILIPKLEEVNHCLSDLLSCSGTPLLSPGGPPLSVPPYSPPPPAVAPQGCLILKEQNRLLTQEVTEKSERITQLQQEKSALIKQLFQTHAHSAGDSTFI